jgi:putative Holliday junction resolvase
MPEGRVEAPMGLSTAGCEGNALGAPVSAASAGRPEPRSFLAFDFGTRRVGVAAGNTLLGRAQSLKTLALEGDARFAAVAALLREWQPDALVVGVPFHPDGAEHDQTRRARRFARQLQGRFRLPVHEVDERYTTTEALAGGARDADAAAAALILDQYLRTLEPLDAAA